jgi:hypothetical protein
MNEEIRRKRKGVRNQYWCNRRRSLNHSQSWRRNIPPSDDPSDTCPQRARKVVTLVILTSHGRGRSAFTYEAHRSRQFHCHSRRVILSGTGRIRTC